MDPDVVAQLEEQLRELTDMLSRQTSAMDAQLDAMNKVAAAAKAASDSMGNNSQTSTTATTNYAEAQAKATAQTGKSEIASKALAAGFGTLSASVSSAIGVFGSLGSSLLSAEQGMAKYGKVADAAASGAENLAKGIPIVGDALGGLVGVVGKVAAQVLTDGLKLVDTFVDMRDGLVQTAGALPVTGEELIKLANNAGYYGERMQVLGKITQGLGTNLAGLGMTAGQGAAKFMELSAVTDDTRRQFGRMGVSQERLTEMQSLYIKSQIVSGNANELQAKSAGQLRKESLAYVENMTKLSSLTGKQAEQLQADQDVAMSEYEEIAKQRQENAQIAQLKSEGRNEEAAAIKREQQNRAEYLKEAAAFYGPAEAAKLGRMARTGVYDQFTGSMAVLGIEAGALKENLKNASSGAEVFTKSYDEINQKTGAMALRVGDALQFMGEEGGSGVGLARGFLEANQKYGDKSLADAKAQAEETLKARKTESDDLADAVENVRSQERQFQAAYQEQLLKGVMYLADAFKQVDLFKMVAENFTGILAGLGTAIASVTALSVGISGAGAMMAARMMGGGAGAAGVGSGLLRGAVGLLGKAGLVGMAGAGAYGAYKGYNADPNASFGGKLLNAGSSGLNMLSFGLLGSSSDDIAANALPAQQAAAANLSRTGVLSPATYGAATEYTGFGMDPETMEEMQDSLVSKNRETTETFEEQKKTFTDLNGAVTTLSGSAGSFKKNLDNSSLALIDLINAVDQLYEAMTGQKRQRSDGSNSGGGTGGQSTVGSVDPEKIKQATAYFEGQGWTKEQAAGLVGNLITESKLDPNAVGDNGKAYGIAQWHPDRQLEFKKWSGQDIKGSSFQKQLEFINYELRGGKEQKAGKALSATTSASEAAMVVDKQYERSTGAALAERQSNAEQIASGNFGGLAGQFKDRAGPKNLATIQAQGKSAQVSSVAADHFQNLLNHLTEVGYKINSLGGYNNRNIAGTNTKSAHARGLAIDINPSANPYGSSLITDLPSSAINFARKSGLGWGGDWSGSKDAMHFSAQKNEGGWVQAERGGILRGPDSGYPAILHGTEMVIPLNNKFTRSMTGANNPAVDKNSRIQQSVIQIVNSETNKAIKAINETNAPMQNMSTEISNSMRKVMEAHNSTMHELTYKLGEMIDAMNTSNDVTKKILKKASA